MLPHQPIKYKRTHHLELRGARVIYQVKWITHRARTTNRRDQVKVTMHASKLKTKQEKNI
jgi:hypothetical protein